uniref:Uncharacterized protein n=1 Tax=Picea glauca TaxID=3330 RepID=A0A101LXH9_PICGL|nr:hypothetical protein ABT39_MTgene6182 [Picea glauca]
MIQEFEPTLYYYLITLGHGVSANPLMKPGTRRGGMHAMIPSLISTGCMDDGSTLPFYYYSYYCLQPRSMELALTH